MPSRALKKRPSTKRKQPKIGLLMVLAVIAVSSIAGLAALYALCESWLQDLPDYQDSSSYNVAQKTKVYASDGTTLLAEFYLEDRDPVSSLDDISDYVVKGTVATEDVRFYEHGGIDPQGILRALFVDVTGGDREGASTITQQFVRNTVLADEAGDSTLERKVREAYISIKLEQMYSKNDILLMYLNTINYGSGAYGIEAAAEKYYSKSAKDLTVAQAATLIGIPQSPTDNNPIDNPDNCLQRRNVVLQRMLDNGVITKDQYNEALSEPLNLNVTASKSGDGIYAYPYFTSYVRQVLLNQYSTDQVFKGGLTVYTTLDVNLQNLAEQAAARKEATLDSDLEVALTAIDPNTGYIKAIVGGKDYYTDQFNLATQATRQAGSSFKTFTLVDAIESGISPQTALNCSSDVTIDGWHVENDDGANYGTTTIANAFAVSSNTGFARLCKYLTPDTVASTAHKLGITSNLNSVLSITLGTQGVTTLEMADAYATIANGGTQRNAVAITKVTDSSGAVIYQADTTGTRAISSEVAYAATKVMEGVITNGTGKAAALSSGQPVAGKTGTTENFYDSWFCGITPQLSVAIWLGAREQRSIGEYTTATSVFSDFVGNALAGQAIVNFPTAADPTYKSVYDADLGIGTAPSSSSASSSASSDTSKNDASSSNASSTASQ